MIGMKPIVMITSWPPRLGGISSFAEEAREFIQNANPGRDVLIICHSDGEGEGVFPIIDLSRADWWKPVVDKIKELDPFVVHIEHEFSLYEYMDEEGKSDNNQGFLELLKAIDDYPLVCEPHTIYGRPHEHEANFINQLCEHSDVVLFKCHYQKWRLDWIFNVYRWKIPKNIMVVPNGARIDKRWGVKEIPSLREELGLDKIPHLGNHLVGMVGWIQSNKRWDILTSMWEEIEAEIYRTTFTHWDLLAAGTMLDKHYQEDYEKVKKDVISLEKKGLAHYYEFVPRGDMYYKMLAVCDFIVIPSVDETQSDTIARVIALNKPFITTAPMEGLTAQTLESEGGLLFTTKDMLKKKVIRLACDEELRFELGNNLRQYLDEEVSWNIVARQYNDAYEMAIDANNTGIKIELPPEF